MNFPWHFAVTQGNIFIALIAAGMAATIYRDCSAERCECAVSASYGNKGSRGDRYYLGNNEHTQSKQVRCITWSGRHWVFPSDAGGADEGGALTNTESLLRHGEHSHDYNNNGNWICGKLWYMRNVVDSRQIISHINLRKSQPELHKNGRILHEELHNNSFTSLTCAIKILRFFYSNVLTSYFSSPQHFLDIKILRKSCLWSSAALCREKK